MATLMIVESPAKAKKIQSILGAQYDVKSSFGHIRDLPQHELGVNVETLSPTYEITEDKQKIVANLKRHASGPVILATDDDREGEAIAWHLQKALGLGENYQRVVYGQVTAEAIKTALQQPRAIDMNRVKAQEARRVLDRLIGYIVSPALSERAGIALSAGRVQSVAARMVVERERAITNFTPEPYYEPVFIPDSHPQIEAHLALEGWVGAGDKHLYRAAIARQFSANKAATLVKVVAKERTVNPRPPLVTVTLQEIAGNRFGMSGSQVMNAAQGLFDNGHITYHRTDNPNLSVEGFDEICQLLDAQQIPRASRQPTFQAKEDAQQAHEAIRPSHPEIEYAGSSEDEQRLYKLIRERALLSCMPAGTDALSQLVFQGHQRFTDAQGQDRTPLFVAKGRVVREPGWRAYAAIEPVETKDTPLPALTKGQHFTGTTEVREKQTEPPKRYTQPSLTKALEASGIGRPATYASIIGNILERDYIHPMEKGKKNAAAPLAPGEHGYYVVDALYQMQFMNYRYTSQVEATLDKVAQGTMDYINIVRPVYNQILDDVSHRLGGEPLVRMEACPNCSRRVVQRQARKNKEHTFWVHVRREDSEGCYQFLDDSGGFPAIPEPPQESTCPNCQHPIKRLPGKGKGPFWVHLNRDHAEPCGYTYINDDNGTPQLPTPTLNATCLLCGETLKRLYSRKNSGFFWVHDQQEHQCERNTFPDNDGEPDFPNTG